MMDFLLQIDRDIFLILHQLHRSLFLDNVMWLVSARWTWVPMYIVLGWWLLRCFGWRQALLWLAVTGLAVACADQLCASLIRPMIGRLRPANLDNPLSEMVTVVRNYRGGPNGFPSCHAANTVALAVLMTLLFRNKTLSWWLFAWALLNCFSRVYLGVHYPGDLLIGALVGACSAFALFYAGKFSVKHFEIGSRRVRETEPRFNPPAVVGLSTIVLVLLISLF